MGIDRITISISTPAAISAANDIGLAPGGERPAGTYARQILAACSSTCRGPRAASSASSLLRDVFAWAYERSCCAIPLSVTRSPSRIPAPAQRDHLTEVVNAIVHDDPPIDDAPIRCLAAPVVAPTTSRDFIAMAIAS